MKELTEQLSKIDGKSPASAIYVVAQKGITGLIAWSPSKYAGMHNIGPLWTGAVFESKEDAQAITECTDNTYEVLELQAAVFEDIKKQAEAGKSGGEKYGQNYIRNIFDHIINDLNLLENPDKYSVKRKMENL